MQDVRFSSQGHVPALDTCALSTMCAYFLKSVKRAKNILQIQIDNAEDEFSFLQP